MKSTSSAWSFGAIRPPLCSKCWTPSRTLRSMITISTSNMLHTIPPAPQDRLEIIRLPGYTEREKLEIAKRHLLPKQFEANGLKPEQIDFDEEGLRTITQYYTREAGVRSLEREIASVLRKLARRMLPSDDPSSYHGVVEAELVKELL